MDNIDKISSLAECNFKELSGKATIRIPKIQRDYAQGRKNDTANEIRSKFVHSLINAVYAGSSLELDFIYGNNHNNAFEPLDGQQRLTTLFLLHWMLGSNLYCSEKDGAVLSYETRNSSKDFCRELVQHSASSFRNEILDKTQQKKDAIESAKNRISELDKDFEDKESKDYLEQIEEAKKSLDAANRMSIPSFSILIRNRGWFDYLWQYDPTIQSMLVMIDAIEDEISSLYEDNQDSNIDLYELCRNLDKITFSYLNLGDFGLSDELFIKMNARGKQLSSYDITKSTLEEEIQIQKKENFCDDTIEAAWRSHVDGEWIDWFWNMFASPKIDEISEDPKKYALRLQAAKDCEEKLKRLILRTICLDFQRRSELGDALAKATYDDSLWNIDHLMTTYQDSLRIDRKGDAVPNKNKVIDFNSILSRINCLYYKDDDDYYRSILDLIPNYYNASEVKNEMNSLAFMLEDNAPNDSKVIFYAIQQYLLLCPIQLHITNTQGIEKGEPDDKWKANFIEWAHFCRNVFINSNNNDRIDKEYKFKSALNGVDSVLSYLKDFLNDETIFEKSTVCFIAYLDNKKIVGIDNQSLIEEIEKAKLKLSSDPQWSFYIGEAEKSSYLWGQIRCLINWAEGDIQKFKLYIEKLSSILTFEDINLIYTGMIWVYPDHGFKTGKLFQFWNKHRDYSIKRYLRDEEVKSRNGFYAPALKILIDKWNNEYPTLSIEEFLKKSSEEMKTSDKSYRRCLIVNPSLFNEAWDRMILSHNGHYILPQKKTENSHCFDIALLYLYKEMEGKEQFDKVHHYDSYGVAHQYALAFEASGNKYLVQAEENGAYELFSGEHSIQNFISEKELLEYFEATYSIS